MLQPYKAAQTFALALLSGSLLNGFAPAPARADDDHGHDHRLVPKIIADVPVSPGAGSGGVAINTRTNRVYIASFFTYTISVLDGKNNVIIDAIPVGNQSYIGPGENQLPFGVPNGPSQPVVDERTNTVYVINQNGILLLMARMTKSLPITPSTRVRYIRSFTQDMVLSYKTEKLYIANYATQIDVVDAKTGKMLAQNTR